MSIDRRLQSFVLRLVVGAAAVATAAGCGLPPTEINLQKEGVNTYLHGSTTDNAAQAASLRRLIGGNCVVVDPGTTKLCVQLAAPATTSAQSCTVRSRTAAGVTSAGTAGSCDTEAVSAEGASPRTYTLACTAVTSGPCIQGGAATLVTLASDVDFETLATNSGNLDGYVLTDAKTPALKVTLHNGATFCDKDFAAGGG